MATLPVITWISQVLNTKIGKYFNELNKLNEIAKILQKEKFKNGAIEFEQEEIKFKLDEAGKPIGVYKKARLDTHKLVEEYMLLANREVAKDILRLSDKEEKIDNFKYENNEFSSITKNNSASTLCISLLWSCM